MGIYLKASHLTFIPHRGRDNENDLLIYRRRFLEVLNSSKEQHTFNK